MSKVTRLFFSNVLVRLKNPKTISIGQFQIKNYYCESWIKNQHTKTNTSSDTIIKEINNNTITVLEELKVLKEQNQINKKILQEQDNKIKTLLKILR